MYRKLCSKICMDTWTKLGFRCERNAKVRYGQQAHRECKPTQRSADV